MTIIAYLSAAKNKFDLKKSDKTKILLIVVTGIISAAHSKLIAFFVITSMIFMFDNVYWMLKQSKIPKGLLNANNKIVYALIIIFSLYSADTGRRTKYNFIIKNSYPYAAIQLLKENNIKGNLFVEMTYGSFCAYKLFPQNKIFMDGRYEEVYNPDLLNVMKNFIRQEGNNKDAVITDYGTDIVLLKYPVYFADFLYTNKTTPAVEKLQNLYWKKIYDNRYWVMFVRSDYPIKDIKEIEYSPKNTYKTLFKTEITKELLLDMENANK